MTGLTLFFIMLIESTRSAFAFSEQASFDINAVGVPVNHFYFPSSVLSFLSAISSISGIISLFLIFVAVPFIMIKTLILGKEFLISSKKQISLVVKLLFFFSCLWLLLFIINLFFVFCDGNGCYSTLLHEIVDVIHGLF